MSEVWDAEADHYDRQPDHGLTDPDTRAAWRNLLLEQLMPTTPARIADLGCGTGSLTQLLTHEGYDVVGVDFSFVMAQRARAKTVGHASIVVGDASRPPLHAGQYDAVMCRHVLWALPDPARALRTWIELLNPTGRLVLIEGFWHTGAGLRAREVVQLLREAGRDPHVVRLTDPVYWGGQITDERYCVVA